MPLEDDTNVDRWIAVARPRICDKCLEGASWAANGQQPPGSGDVHAKPWGAPCGMISISPGPSERSSPACLRLQCDQLDSFAEQWPKCGKRGGALGRALAIFRTEPRTRCERGPHPFTS